MPYGSKYLLGKCLGYDLGGVLYLLRQWAWIHSDICI